MPALQHAHLGHIGKTERTVGSGVVEFGRVQQTAIHGGNNFAARQGIYRRAQALENIDRQAHRTEFKTFEVFFFGDRFFVPAQRLRRHWSVQKRHHVQIKGLINFVQQGLAAAIVVPRQHHIGIHTKGRARAPDRHRRIFAVPVREHTVTAIERAFTDCIDQVKRLDDRACRQHFDFQVAAGHIVNFFRVVLCVFVKNIFGWPGALPAHGDRPGLAVGNHRETGNGRTRCGCGSGEEFSARRFGFDRFIFNRRVVGLDFFGHTSSWLELWCDRLNRIFETDSALRSRLLRFDAYRNETAFDASRTSPVTQ